MPYWFRSLRVASFRGVPFAVTAADGDFGRRNAVHDYPYRDTVWVEDLGRQARRIVLTGFLVGDDVVARRDALVGMAESAGEGELVHPTLGRLTVSLQRLTTSERWDRGRVVDLRLVCIEAGQRVFPSSTVSTTAAVSAAAVTADVAAASDFVTAVADALAIGTAIADQVLRTVATWTGLAVAAVASATALYSTVTSLPATLGSFGRYAGAKNSRAATLLAGVTGVDDALARLVAAGVVGRAAVGAAAATASSAAAGLSASGAADFATAIQGVAQAVGTACLDPAGSLRSLEGLTAAGPVAVGGASATAQAMLAADTATATLLRRAAVVAMARAAAEYTPTSYQDAVAVRDRVCGLLAVEITTAGDGGDDATYTALRALRAAVAADLTARGGDLAEVTTVTLPRPQPSLTVAHRLYQDAGRAEELVRRANPPHPAFLPTRFEALSR